MANQGPYRRQVLEMLAKASVASQFPGFSRWVFAGEHQHEQQSEGAPRGMRRENYTPLYFNPTEYRMIDTLTELILPKDESPGARDAGVSEFIDFMAAHGDGDIRQPMRNGLAWLEANAKQMYGSDFANLSPEQQIAILKSVAYKSSVVAVNVTGQAFFELIRRYTVMGFYTSRVGLEELNYPGLKLYSQSPACSHTDDPEHRHLPAPRF